MRNFNVKVNGKTFFVEVEEALGQQGTAQTPVSAPAAAAVPTPAPKTEEPARPMGGLSVIAPLPGLILNLLVENGGTVKKNDKILILEAMKMEHDILAGADGKISFSVKKGDNVETGAELAHIRP